MTRAALGILLVAILAACSKTEAPPPAGAASDANAQPAQRVENAQPDCRQVAVTHKKEWGASGIAGTALGGAAGGLLGNQFGKGQGKTALTAAGAVGGAVGGHELAKGNDTTVSYEERCTH